jgi:hypothetical protein
MKLEIAQKLQSGDKILSNKDEWEVVDIMETDDGIMISACRDDSYEVFSHEDVSSMVLIQ